MSSRERELTVASRMRAERARYLQARKREGGTASGFRDWIRARATDDPRLFPVDALRDEAATKAWESQPRKEGPDLFSVGGIAVPEFLTRSKVGYVDGDAIADDEFEKVAAEFATVNDRYEDAVIKMRKAAQASASAEQQMKQADECRRRARGDMSALLRDIADTGA